MLHRLHIAPFEVEPPLPQKSIKPVSSMSYSFDHWPVICCTVYSP